MVFQKNLVDFLANQQPRIEQWFNTVWQGCIPPFTSSVDLRNAGFKIAAIDANFFPAGFNNLPSLASSFSQQMKTTLKERYPAAQRLLIIPENHTRNLAYYHSLTHLATLLEIAGFEVKIASLLLKEEKMKIDLSDDESFYLYALQKKASTLFIEGFIPDLILLNHDLSDGLPEILKNVTQPIEPSPSLGWWKRRKSQHFCHYQTICQQFAQHFNLDVWQLAPFFYSCEGIDFLEKKGFDCLVETSSQLLEKIQQKYLAYQLPDAPFLILKADAGTYGMSVLSISHVQEIVDLNRKQRNKLSRRKGKQKVESVILQEGIPTIEKSATNQAVAEPVLYMTGTKVMGGFYRVHPHRSAHDNLNTPGMGFEPMNFLPDTNSLHYAYSVIARLSLLAMAQEAKEGALI